MRYGRPKTARRNMINGFFDGFGVPSGRDVGADRPRKNAEKAEGVRDVASAGSGRPVIFAMRVLNHLMSANTPKV
jgi:hypothetical protein